MIDKNKLRELASDPNRTTASVLKELGFNNYATFSYQLKKDPEAQRLFEEGREAAGKAQPAKSSAPKKTTERKTPSAIPPPSTRGSNGKGRVSELLLRKIAHEFEHIKIYEEISERFDDLAAELSKAL